MRRRLFPEGRWALRQMGEEPLGGSGNLYHGGVKSGLIRLRWAAKATYFSDKLERGRGYLVGRGWKLLTA